MSICYGVGGVFRIACRAGDGRSHTPKGTITVKDFYALTVRGQARRLRQMARAALGHYDLDVRRIRLLSNVFNGIFRLDTADGDKAVLRINLPGLRRREEIRSEMMWLDALRRDMPDIGVPRPLRTRDGELMVTVAHPGVPEPRHAVIFSWVPGRDLSHEMSEKNYHGLGALTARLHDHAGRWAPPDGFWLKTLDEVCPFGRPDALFDDAHRESFPPGGREVYREAVDYLDKALRKLYTTRPGPFVLHADLHQLNIRVSRGKLFALDFDDAMIGYPVQDIGITFYHMHREANYAALCEAFRAGYVTQRPWPEQYPREIETQIIWRIVHLTNYVIQSGNPEWRATAPGYIAEMTPRLRAFLASPPLAL
jgi:Ser/Thr protein kinase RdoA (MazF antagonist)